MGINDLFYTDKATIMASVSHKPNEWGIVEQKHEVIAEDIPCSFTPITSLRTQYKYGIDLKISFEVAMDHIENCELATDVVIGGESYKVVSYIVYPPFMCLPKSITYGLRK